MNATTQFNALFEYEEDDVVDDEPELDENKLEDLESKM
jgi:hypothetical protein